MNNASTRFLTRHRPSALALALTVLSLISCKQGGGGSLSVTEDTTPGPNAFSISQVADIDLEVEGAMVTEDAAAGASVGLTAFASDEDPTANTVRYVLTDNAGGRFAIDSATGVVTLARALPASEGSHSIEITASSEDGSRSSARFTVAVLPSNKFEVSAPTDTDASDNSIELSASPGAPVGITASAVDMDSSRNAVSYSLSDSAGGRFAINPTSGVVTLARGLATDVVSEYTIEVMAVSEDGSGKRTQFTIMAARGTKPIILIRFPDLVTLVDAQNIDISGRVRLAGGASATSFTATVGSGQAEAVTVNTDNTWVYRAALAETGTTVVELSLTDSNSETSTTRIFATRFSTAGAQPSLIPMTDARGLALDVANGRAYVVDTNLPGVYLVDLSTGMNSVLSGGGAGGDTVGGGDGFSADLEGGVAIDAANDRLLVTDDGNDNIVAVSLATATLGDRSVLSGSAQSGPAIATPFGLAIDAAGARAFIADTTADGVIAVSLSDGSRTLISSAGDGGRGTGPALPSPRGLAWDGANNRLFVIGTNPDDLVEVDVGTVAAPGTGNRAIITDPVAADATGKIDFDSARDLALDSASGRVYVVDFAGEEGIVSVDLGASPGAIAGARTIVANAVTGSGAPFSGARGVAADPDNNRLIVTDSDSDVLVAVDLASGDRTPIAPPGPERGAGPKLSRPTGVVFDEDNYRLLVADDGLDAIVAVNLRNGDRTIVSNADRAGIPLSDLRGLGWNADNTALLAPRNGEDAILSIDPATGLATIVASATVGAAVNSAPNFGSPRGHIAALSATSILVADTARDSLFMIDTSSGDRRVLATAPGAELEGIQSVIPGQANASGVVENALAVSGSATNDATQDVVVAVALADGAITPVASAAVGTGDALTDPRALALDTGGGRLLVLDVGLNALVAVDPGTGDRTVLSSAANADGGFLDDFGGASGIVLDDERGVVYVVNEQSGSVLMIDLSSGDQAVVSR